MKTHITPNVYRSNVFKAIYLTSILLTINASILQAQQEKNYSVYANIVYRFTKYINWPDNKKSGDFVIGIKGDSPLYDELKTFVTRRTAGNQKIVIKKFSPSSEVYDCHILFIAEDASRYLKKIAAGTSGMAVLLVSEADGLAHKGSCINFIISDDHLKLEINKNNIQQRQLSIATELLSLGMIVN